MRRILLLFPVLFLFLSNGFAQHRQCGSMEVLQRQLLENPSLQQHREAIERHIQQVVQQGGSTERTVYTIPVVFHVLWNTTAENVNDAQIASQMTVLNNDFRKLNADASLVPSYWQGIAADCEVNFCMATQDQFGATTTGIERRNCTQTSWSSNDAMKYFSQGGLDAWDASKYLNIWVCDLGSGLLGYAQFPGGPGATDGVVIDYQAFGTNGSAAAPFNKGRTGTHEVGHWLNLYHIWGDDGTACTGSDQVADTPNQADENYNCPGAGTILISCNNGPNGDMWMNYMDYTDDACMYMFTAGQKARCQAVLGSGGSRASLASSPGCQAPSGCGTPTGLAATSITQTSAVLGWNSVSGATAYNLQWKANSATTWTTVANLSTNSHSLSGLTAGTTYNFKVQAICGANTGNYSAAVNFTTQSGGGGGCTDFCEPNNSRSTACTSTPVGTSFQAKINTATDKDWYKFANNSANRNIKIELTTLPADYDLRLYRNSTLLQTSENAGTADETIIQNTTTVASNYYAYVYGYNGAFNNSTCYTLKISLSAGQFRSDGTTDGPVEEIEVPVLFEDAGFGIFPNPATDAVTLEIPMTAEAEVKIAVLDPSGRTVAASNPTLSKANNRVQLDLSKAPSGLYYVQVRNGDTVKTRKLVLNK